MRFMQRSLMGLFMLAFTLGLLALAAGSVRTSLEERFANEGKSRPARERVFTVNVIAAVKVEIAPKIETFGEIRSRRTLDLRAPSSGTITELSANFVEGGQVMKGDLLIRLDPANAQSALEVALSESAEAAAELAEALAALSLAQDEVLAARAQAELRKVSLKRQEDLRTRGVGTEAAVETAALAHASANQATLGKRQALAQANARISRAEITVARREIRLRESRRNLAETNVFAEFDGVLSTANQVVGGLVGANEKLARLIDPTALEVVFRLSNSQYARLVAANNGSAKGDVAVSLDILGAKVNANGTIDRVGAEVGEGQTGRQIFARLPMAAANSFRPGDFVSVSVDEPKLSDVAVLPSTAVDAAGVVLLLGENDRLEELQVELVRKQGDMVIVRGRGLFEREVIEARSPLLGAGIRVKPLRRDGAAIPDVPKMIELSEERRAKLMAFIENAKRMPKDARDRILGNLQKDKVPEEMVIRIEARMGG